MKSDPIYFKTLMYFMIVATVAMAVAITVAKMPPFPEPEGTFMWNRLDHQVEETNTIEHVNGTTEVFYNDNNKPFFRAIYKDGSHYAFQLGVDMDQNGVIDFTILDVDGDHYLDFDMILCHENCEEVLRRALLLFQGKLILEKTI